MTVLTIYRHLRHPTISILIIATCALLLLFPPTTQAQAGVASGMASTGPLNFRVWLGDREIGTHAVTIKQMAERTEVLSKVLYNVKVLFVNVFNYQHTSAETWQSGCLQSIESNTVENGDKSNVQGQRDDERFKLLINEQTSADYGPCIGTYAYWDEQLIQRDALMNAQTGQLDETTVKSIDAQPLPRLAESLPDMRNYVIQTPEADIDVWYADNGTWLALQTDVDGKPLVYLNDTLLDK